MDQFRRPFWRGEAKAAASDPFFLSLFLSISLFLEQNNILLSHLIMFHLPDLIHAFILLLFVDLLTVVLQGRRRKTAVSSRRQAAPPPASDSLTFPLPVPMISLHASVPTIVLPAAVQSPSLPVSVPSPLPARPEFEVDFAEPEPEEEEKELYIYTFAEPEPEEDEEEELYTFAEPKYEEEELYSFTVISAEYDCAFGYYQFRIDQEIMKALFMGLGVGSEIRSVDSCRFVYTVGVPNHGLVLVHRHLVGMGTVQADPVFQYIFASIYDIGPQLMLRSNESQSVSVSCASSRTATLSAPHEQLETDTDLASHQIEVSSSVEVHDTALFIGAWTDSSDSDMSSTNSDMSSTDSDTSSTDLDMPITESDTSSTESVMHKKALRRSPHFAEREKRRQDDLPTISAKPRRSSGLAAKENQTEKKEHRIEEARPRRSSRLAEKAGKARVMK